MKGVATLASLFRTFWDFRIHRYCLKLWKKPVSGWLGSDVLSESRWMKDKPFLSTFRRLSKVENIFLQFTRELRRIIKATRSQASQTFMSRKPEKMQNTSEMNTHSIIADLHSRVCRPLWSLADSFCFKHIRSSVLRGPKHKKATSSRAEWWKWEVSRGQHTHFARIKMFFIFQSCPRVFVIENDKNIVNGVCEAKQCEEAVKSVHKRCAWRVRCRECQ